jgi:hypothetical protein
VIVDNDDAGNSMGSKIVEKIGSRSQIIRLDKKYKDIGDMLDSDIIELESDFKSDIIGRLQ